MDSSEAYIITGDLTIRGTTRIAELVVDFGGIATVPCGNVKFGFERTRKINRKDFVLHRSVVSETGGMVVADESKPQINIELAKQFRTVFGCCNGKTRYPAGRNTDAQTT